MEDNRQSQDNTPRHGLLMPHKLEMTRHCDGFI